MTSDNQKVSIAFFLSSTFVQIRTILALAVGKSKKDSETKCLCRIFVPSSAPEAVSSTARISAFLFSTCLCVLSPHSSIVARLEEQVLERKVF